MAGGRLAQPTEETMAENDLALIAHLMRRAGFGATRAELEALSAKEYEATVDDLLHPERFPDVEEDVLKRYHLEIAYQDSFAAQTSHWMYRMINTVRPLEEKMALFWHHVLAAGHYKGEHTPTMVAHIDMFRRLGLTNVRTVLLEVAKDPAMNYWLDNCENHSAQPNENWGRELLELFSMGVGNYTEADIKNAARAFTGWTFRQPIPLYPYGQYASEFQFVADDHDYGEKTFLGETGCFDGEDIIDIIVKQPAAARFIARHMYNFFVADEPQVPAWELEPPQDPDAIDALTKAYFDSDGDIRAILKTLFNSDFFKGARAKKVKSPVELVAGTIKLIGTHRFPEPGLPQLSETAGVMGQQLMNPPTVEGWHTGREWIDGGTLNERVNFAVNAFNDATKPGIQDIIESLRSSDDSLSPDELVDRCLELIGPMEVSGDTRDGLLRYASAGGELRFDGEDSKEQTATRVSRLLQLIVASRDYQFA